MRFACKAMSYSGRGWTMSNSFLSVFIGCMDLLRWIWRASAGPLEPIHQLGSSKAGSRRRCQVPRSSRHLPRKFYISSEIFFLPHLPVFEICANHLIRWIFSALSSFSSSPFSHRAPPPRRRTRWRAARRRRGLLLRAAALLLQGTARCCSATHAAAACCFAAPHAAASAPRRRRRRWIKKNIDLNFDLLNLFF